MIPPRRRWSNLGDISKTDMCRTEGTSIPMPVRTPIWREVSSESGILRYAR